MQLSLMEIGMRLLSRPWLGIRIKSHVQKGSDSVKLFLSGLRDRVKEKYGRSFSCVFLIGLCSSDVYKTCYVISVESLAR